MAVSLSRRTGAVAFLAWIWDGLDRTIFTAIKFSFPARFVSPFGFLGMLTFITFVILGISGALLMFYYEPILDRAWDSVFINNDVPFGFHIRNIHYHGSNAMVLLAILHMYYQYFSGRYKIRNEILWVTGVILGTVTILEAFTGYDIIFSERAELAISIAASLTNSIPVVGSLIRETMFGNGCPRFWLRFCPSWSSFPCQKGNGSGYSRIAYPTTPLLLTPQVGGDIHRLPSESCSKSSFGSGSY